MRAKLTATLAAAAAIAGLTACGGTSAAKVGQAPPASQPASILSSAGVLNGDGYTVDPATIITASQALINMGVADRASGTRGGRAEQVLIFNGHPSASVPACKTTSVCTPAGMAAEIASADLGTHASVSGLVLRITGTAATFTADGLPV